MENSKSECPDMWIRLPRHKSPKSWSSMEDPVVPLERNLYGHPLAGLLWERQFEKILLKYRWEKVSKLGMLIRTVKKGLFLSVSVDDIKLAGKKQSINSMWKVLNKEVDVGEPTPFLDHENLGCTQRECQTSEYIADNYQERQKSYLFQGKLSVTWKVMPRNVWNDIVNWQTKQLNNFSRSQLHVLTTTNSKKKNWNPWENCQKYALKLFWSAYTWHVFEELIFYGRWTHLHDRSQNGPKLVTNDYPVWSLTFIIHVNTNNIVMWETLQNKADWDCFKTPILQESWGFKINFGENLVYLWKSHVCSNQLDV